MSKFGKALKPVDVDRLIDFVKTEIQKKPKRYRPKMTEEEYARRRRKARYKWYKRERNTHGYTVYYDRKRKGWFYRDNFGNRYGYRNSKDRGYDSRDKAINAIQRKYRKKLKEQKEYLEENLTPHNETLDIDEWLDRPPITVTSFQYNPYTSDTICEYRRSRYGGSTPPSGSAYMKLFGGFVDEWPVVDMTQYTKSQIEKKQDNNFIILELLHLLKYEPVYDENNRCIGLEDL